ncbi:hypothetical protein C0J52_25028 [Blattella germanica]|nr:hypothetical protein C0J52_25028 [Blattella germanica]
MTSPQEKVMCCLWLAELKSVTGVQRKFRLVYHRQPPTRRSIYQWMNKHKETGRLRVSDERVEEVRDAFVRSLNYRRSPQKREANEIAQNKGNKENETIKKKSTAKTCRQRSLSEGNKVPSHEIQVPDQDLATTVKEQNKLNEEVEREEPFIEWRGRRNRRRHQVIGTMAEETDLKSGQRMSWIYVGRLHEKTSTATLIQHVKKNGIRGEIECEEVETPGRLKAFKLFIPFEALEEAKQPDF